MALAGCGGGSPPARTASAPHAEPPPSGPAFGLTEDNALLLWHPAGGAAAGSDPFLAARRELTALHPRYLRLLVNWAALQPSPQSPPELEASTSGCAREVAPCGSYAGVGAQLAAIASQQRAARAEGREAFEVVIDVLGAPRWAALPSHGCEAPGAGASARPIAPAALVAYRALIRALVALGRREGVALPWWSPWNEPNDPRFLGPQRETCDAHGPPAATAVYAQLASALSEELKVDAPGDRVLLGELGGYDQGSTHRLSIAEFVRSLPAGVLCLSDTWSIHAYAGRDGHGAGPDPVRVLESALDERGGCAAGAHVWVTEAGAGAAEPGRRRAGGAEGREACMALGAQLATWRADPRVGAVFQYTFRDDPDYPVGVVSADLRRLEPVYRLWLDSLKAGVLTAPVQALETICQG